MDLSPMSPIFAASGIHGLNKVSKNSMARDSDWYVINTQIRIGVTKVTAQ